MKKTFKKLMAALLAVALLCAMAVPAFAADAPGSITISNAVVGETYNAYKMFDVLGQNGEGSNVTYTYKVDSKWKAFFSVGGAGYQYIQLDKLDQPILPESGLSADNARELAKAAVAYATNSVNGITAAGTATAAGTTGEPTSVTIDRLPLGYYVVDTSLGSLCSLDTVGGANVAIREKNGVPTIDKKVKSNGSENYAETNTAAVGDTVNYKVTIHAKEGAAGYVLTDTLSKGLTFSEDSIKITDNKSNTLTKGTDYTVVTTPNADGSTTFKVTFLDAYLKKVVNDTEIYVDYNAVLNKDAIINNETTGNTNTAKLHYGNGSTVEEKTNTYSFKFDLVKTDESSNLLAGAEFQIYTKESGGDPLAFVATDDGFRLAQTGEENTVTTLVLKDKKAYTISGLNKQSYYLEETKAPGGYNRLTDRVAVDLTVDTNLTSAKINDLKLTNGGFKVENHTGATLPSTGGMGTTLFYVIGGGLMVAAVVLLVTKKRMENK